MNILIIGLLVVILASLVVGGFFLYKDKSESKRTLNALRLRVGLSVLLIIVLVGSHYAGCMPNNSPINQAAPQ